MTAQGAPVNGRPPLLHVIGAGPWQLATIRRARALGCRVLVTDGLQDRPGFTEADLHALADITDAEATLAVARRHGVDGILCDTTDNGVLTAALVAERLGLPGIGIEAAQACTNKALMTERAAAAGLRVPRSVRAATRAQALAAVRGASVVKPVDNQAGRGVAFVRDPRQAPTAVDAAFAHSRCGEVLVQEWIEGDEFIVDSIVVEGQVHLLGVAAKTPYADNPTISSSIGYGSAAPPGIEDVNRRLVQALGIRQGLVHAEVRVADGTPVPIDVAARGGGVLIYPVVLPHVSGVDAMTTAIRLALGQPVRVSPSACRRAAEIRFLRSAPGRIAAIEGLAEARAVPGVAAVHLNQRPGDVTGTLAHKDERLGYVVALADTRDEAMAVADRACSRIEIQVADGRQIAEEPR